MNITSFTRKNKPNQAQIEDKNFVQEKKEK